jgi:GxxExxY protein
MTAQQKKVVTDAP